MKTPENCVQLCQNCPNRFLEGVSDQDLPTGDLVGKKSRFVNFHLEFVSSPDEIPDVPTQEYAVQFVDTEGNTTMSFLPGTELEDIAACEQPVVSYRSGFLGRNKHYDCGSQALSLVAIREQDRKRRIAEQNDTSW